MVKASEENKENLPLAARLAALREAGLSAAADEGMERFARLVAGMVGVPVALVSLVRRTGRCSPAWSGWPSRGQPAARPRCRIRCAST